MNQSFPKRDCALFCPPALRRRDVERASEPAANALAPLDLRARAPAWRGSALWRGDARAARRNRRRASATILADLSPLNERSLAPRAQVLHFRFGARAAGARLPTTQGGVRGALWVTVRQTSQHGRSRASPGETAQLSTEWRGGAARAGVISRAARRGGDVERGAWFVVMLSRRAGQIINSLPAAAAGGDCADRTSTRHGGEDRSTHRGDGVERPAPRQVPHERAPAESHGRLELAEVWPRACSDMRTHVPGQRGVDGSSAMPAAPPLDMWKQWDEQRGVEACGTMPIALTNGSRQDRVRPTNHAPFSATSPSAPSRSAKNFRARPAESAALVGVGREPVGSAKMVVLVGNRCFRGRRVMPGELGQVRTRDCILHLDLHLDCVVDPSSYAIGLRHRGESRDRARPLQRPACGSFLGLWARSASALIGVCSLFTLQVTTRKRTWAVTRLDFRRPRLARALARRSLTKNERLAIVRKFILYEPRLKR